MKRASGGCQQAARGHVSEVICAITSAVTSSVCIQFTCQLQEHGLRDVGVASGGVCVQCPF